jgi:hypothetical protein
VAEAITEADSIETMDRDPVAVTMAIHKPTRNINSIFIDQEW